MYKYYGQPIFTQIYHSQPFSTSIYLLILYNYLFTDNSDFNDIYTKDLLKKEPTEEDIENYFAKVHVYLTIIGESEYNMKNNAVKENVVITPSETT